jgi:hypothetical protein
MTGRSMVLKARTVEDDYDDEEDADRNPSQSGHGSIRTCTTAMKEQAPVVKPARTDMDRNLSSRPMRSTLISTNSTYGH